MNDALFSSESVSIAYLKSCKRKDEKLFACKIVYRYGMEITIDTKEEIKKRIAIEKKSEYYIGHIMYRMKKAILTR